MGRRQRGVTFPRDYSYLIYREGNRYKAKPGIPTLPWQREATAGALFNAVENALVNGGGVQIMAGTYLIDQTIYLLEDRPTWYFGAGIGATILQLDDGADCDIFDYTPATQWHFKGLLYMHLHGNKANNTLGHGVITNNADGTTPADLHMEHLFVSTFPEAGLELLNTWGFRICNVLCEYNDGQGMVLTGGQTYLVNVYTAINDLEGLLIDASAKHLVVNCRSDANGRDGFNIKCHESVFANLQGYNNGSEAGTWAGLHIQHDNNIFVGVIMDGNALTDYGVWFSAIADENYLDNYFAMNNVTADVLDQGARNRINGLGREAALTGVAPVAANWQTGDIVQNPDFPTEIWMKDYAGVMQRLA